MSTKSLTTGLGFTRAAAGHNWLDRVWQTSRRIFAALAEGREAEYAYRRLVARGLAPDRAARLVLAGVLGHK